MTENLANYLSTALRYGIGIKPVSVQQVEVVRIQKQVTHLDQGHFLVESRFSLSLDEIA